MDGDQFAVAGRQMIDYVISYLENIRDRRVFPTVKPGYLRELIPPDAPEKAESWEAVFNDIERVIMPGVSKMATAPLMSLLVRYQIGEFSWPKKKVLHLYHLSQGLKECHITYNGTLCTVTSIAIRLTVFTEENYRDRWSLLQRAPYTYVSM